MQNHAAHSDLSSNAKFSRLVWPPTDDARFTHRALGAQLWKLLTSFTTQTRGAIGRIAAFLKRADLSERDVAACYDGHKWCDSSERHLNEELAAIRHGQALPFQRDD